MSAFGDLDYSGRPLPPIDVNVGYGGFSCCVACAITPPEDACSGCPRPAAAALRQRRSQHFAVRTQPSTTRRRWRLRRRKRP